MPIKTRKDVIRVVLAIVLFASPSLAAFKVKWVNCNVTQVTNGVCNDTTGQALIVNFSDAAVTRIIADYGSTWPPLVNCTQAMVDLAQCTAPQLGTLVSNPQSHKRYTAQKIRDAILEHELNFSREQTRSAKASAAAADLAAALATLLAADTGGE